MNKEALEQIITLIQSLSGDAQSVIIWYIAYSLVKIPLIAASLFGGAALITRTVARAVNATPEMAMRRLRDAAGIGSYGAMTERETEDTVAYYLNNQSKQK